MRTVIPVNSYLTSVTGKHPQRYSLTQLSAGVTAAGANLFSILNSHGSNHVRIYRIAVSCSGITSVGTSIVIAVHRTTGAVTAGSAYGIGIKKDTQDATAAFRLSTGGATSAQPLLLLGGRKTGAAELGSIRDVWQAYDIRDQIIVPPGGGIRLLNQFATDADSAVNFTLEWEEP